VGGGGIITYYEDSGSAVTPSLNTSIRVIAGSYYSNNNTTDVQLTMPSASASNDYMNIEFVVSSNASNGGYTGILMVTFPGLTSNTYSQSSARMVSYFWDSNAMVWTVTDFRSSATTYYT
jgi:hypothetical protein